VTGAALLLGRERQVDLALSSGGRHLVVGIMAANAIGQFLPRWVCQAAMGSFVDLIEDVSVAVLTRLDTEEILETLVDVPGIRMRLLPWNVTVTFQAGCPAMGRNVESFRINQPAGTGTIDPTQKDNRREKDKTALALVVGSDSCPQHQ
jgi:hypothetical protein